MAGATGTVDGLSHWFGETNVVQLLWMAGATGFETQILYSSCGWLVPLRGTVDGWCHSFSETIFAQLFWMAGATGTVL